MEKNKIIILVTVIIFIGIFILFYEQNQKQEENKYEELYVTEIIEEPANKKETIKIHISGETNYNGILELEEGSRVDDAIQKAGGLTENADIDKINLAYTLSDGQKVYVPSVQDTEEKEYITNEFSGMEETESLVNINTAAQTELETLPGVGPSLALKIIKYREENGKFKTKEELKNVSGIGEKKYGEIEEYVKIK